MRDESSSQQFICRCRPALCWIHFSLVFGIHSEISVLYSDGEFLTDLIGIFFFHYYTANTEQAPVSIGIVETFQFLKRKFSANMNLKGK